MATTTITKPRQVERPVKRRSGVARLRQASPLTYFALIAAVVLSIFPLYFMVVGATLTNDELFKVPPRLIPGSHVIQNLRIVFGNEDANLAKGLLNSVIICSCVTISVVFFSSLAGF